MHIHMHMNTHIFSLISEIKKVTRSKNNLQNDCICPYLPNLPEVEGGPQVQAGGPAVANENAWVGGSGVEEEAEAGEVAYDVEGVSLSFSQVCCLHCSLWVRGCFPCL